MDSFRITGQSFNVGLNGSGHVQEQNPAPGARKYRIANLTSGPAIVMFGPDQTTVTGVSASGGTGYIYALPANTVEVVDLTDLLGTNDTAWVGVYLEVATGQGVMITAGE